MCVCGEGWWGGWEGRKTGGEWRGDKKERKGRGREVGGGEREGRKGKGKELLMFRGRRTFRMEVG